MNLRERKRLLFFLQELEHYYENHSKEERSKELLKLFTDTEIRELILWLYPKTYTKEELGTIERAKLLESITSNKVLLWWVAVQLEKSIISSAEFSQNEANEFFSITQNEIHYLASKPIETWDSYDFANYQNLLRKSGNGKLVYAIFTADVAEKDKYMVTTKPNFFFDTKEEAEQEMERYYREDQCKKGSLKVMSLWQINF